MNDTSLDDVYTAIVKAFEIVFSLACAKDTAAGGGKGWTPENPTWGHCAVASLLVQDLFGGELLRVSLEGTEFAEGRSHYFNRLPDGTIVDATLKQFQKRLPADLPAEVRSRDYVIGGADTRERYERLKARVSREGNFAWPLT